jgi:[ribosomal protein S5]-alanine N-acetyltransferase
VAQLARFRGHWERHGFGIFAVEERESGGFVGRCGPAYHRLWPDQPELGFMLAPAVWRRGYATEAGAACLPLLFDELGFERVVSIVRRENERSLHVQDRLGFRDWREVLWPETGITLLVRSLTRGEWQIRRA